MRFKYSREGGQRSLGEMGVRALHRNSKNLRQHGQTQRPPWIVGYLNMDISEAQQRKHRNRRGKNSRRRNKERGRHRDTQRETAATQNSRLQVKCRIRGETRRETEQKRQDRDRPDPYSYKLQAVVSPHSRIAAPVPGGAATFRWLWQQETPKRLRTQKSETRQTRQGKTRKKKRPPRDSLGLPNAKAPATKTQQQRKPLPCPLCSSRES